MRIDKSNIPDQPIVYQMGKVGSVSIQVALRLNGMRSLHSHNLIWEDGDYYTPKPGLLEAIQTQKGRRWRFVTPIRDPVARNISSFFQQIEKFYPKWKDYSKEGMLDAFLHGYQKHRCVLEWFDKEFYPVLDLDVYEYPFDKASGYQIYKKDKLTILIIQAECLNSRGAEALTKFFGDGRKLSRLRKPKFTIGNHNVLVKRSPHLKEMYEVFRREIPIPECYLDMIYGSKFSQHFYTNMQLKKFYNFWRNKDVS